MDSNEILEGVTADALRSCGFDVKTNKVLKSRHSSGTEVDVWASRTVPELEEDILVYVSCKNWNTRSAGVSFLNKEAGRVAALHQVPHHRALVAPEFYDTTKGAAFANGFVPIEVEQKVTKENVHSMYRYIRDVFIHSLGGVKHTVPTERFEISWACPNCRAVTHPEIDACADCGIVFDETVTPILESEFSGPIAIYS